MTRIDRWGATEVLESSGGHPASVPAAAAQRASGIFAPISALPSEHGIGDLGPAARQFADVLADGQQRVWQILPLAEPGNPANSPYDNHSGHANNRWLLSPDDLVGDGLLTPDDVAAGRPSLPADHVDYGAAQAWKRPLIERAADNLLARAESDPAVARELRGFEERNRSWLDDFVNFTELKRRHAGADAPTFSRSTWPLEDRVATTAQLPEVATSNMRRTVAEQFLLDQQWTRLRNHAAAQGVRIMTDLPFYEGDDGVAAWKRPELFEFDDAHRATLVGGAPPEPAFPAGQSWGMPAYRTERRAELIEHFADRIGHEARRVGPGGLVRLDHLLGAAAPYYALADEAGDAATVGFRTLFSGSEWKELLDRFPDVTFVGEDLGTLTPERRAFMEELDPARMRVGAESLLHDEPLEASAHFADNVGTRDVMFTGGTHDYPYLRTALHERWDAAPVRELRSVLEQRGLTGPSAGLEDVARGVMQLNMDSPASLAVTQVFDALGMGGGPELPQHLRAFNVPGTVSAANWATRIPGSVLGEGRSAFVDTLAGMARLAGRL